MDQRQENLAVVTELSSDRLGAFLHEQRRKVGDLLSRQRSKCHDLGDRLTAEIQTLSEQIRTELSGDFERERAQLETVRQQLLGQQTDFMSAQEQTARELQAWSDQLTQREKELTRRDAEAEAAAAQLRQSERQLATDRVEFTAEESQIQRRRVRLDEQQKRLDAELESLEARRGETREQRKRIAERLKAERATQLEEIEFKRREVDVLRDAAKHEAERDLQAFRDRLENQARLLQEQETQLSQEQEQFRKQIERKDSASVNKDHAQAAETWSNERAQLTVRVAELEAVVAGHADERLEYQALLDEALEVPNSAQSTGEIILGAADPALQEQLCAQTAELAALRDEREQLAARVLGLELNHAAEAEQAAQILAGEAERAALAAKLAAADERLADAEAKLQQQAEVEQDPNRIAELERRCELALEDVRGLKRRNGELESQLSSARENGGTAAPPAGDNWESLKKKMLAQLESQGDEALADEERFNLERTIQQTEEIVAQKEREMTDLRQLLQEQSNNYGEMALGAAAVSQIFDHDKLIQAERDRLRIAQEEWRQKLRQAEVEISLERARLARDRAEIEEKSKSLASQQAHAVDYAKAAGETDKDRKPARGRWLTRLGLKDN